MVIPKKIDKKINGIWIIACCLVISVWLLSFVAKAEAETLIGSNVDKRTTVAFRVGQAELQSWLPAPWQVNPVAKGPLKEANLYLTFMNRLLDQNPEGKPTAGGTYRVLALSVPAKNSQTGESALFVIRIFSSHETGIYNPYKNSVHANISLEQTIKSENVGPGTGSELWTIRDSVGDEIVFQIEYQCAVPSRAKIELKPHSSVDPTFYRIYRYDQGSDLIKSIPDGINRVKSYKFRVTIKELSKIFDGTEQLVGIVVAPWYVRQLFLP